MRNPKTALALFVILSAVLFFGGCGKNPEKTAPSDANKREYPSQEGWQSTYRITKAGRPQAVIQYGHMEKYDRQATYYFDEDVQVDFYDETGRHTSVLTAERGTYQEKTGDVYGMGNVVIVSDTGVTVFTEKIRWDEKRAKILSDTLTTIIQQDGDTLYCEGFVSNPDLTKIVFLKPWGNSGHRIDFDKIESDLAEAPRQDTVQVPAVLDTTSAMGDGL